MTSSYRKMDALVATLELVVLLAALLGGAASNELPSHVPAAIQAHSEQYFAGTILLTLLITVAVMGLQPRTTQETINRRRQRLVVSLRVLQGLAVAVTGVLGNLVAQAVQASPLVIALAVFILAVTIFLPLVSDFVVARSGRAITDREAFLQQLSRRYGKFLHDPLQQAAHAEPGIAETPAALR
jgi:hypothetical protein